MNKEATFAGGFFLHEISIVQTTYNSECHVFPLSYGLLPFFIKLFLIFNVDLNELTLKNELDWQ
ncbi:hypothetical protein ACQKPX_23590 [Photobacterium sp. DNB23_23_1]|uniref:Uncharacterized protein n=1 Tax=Photobacterium pectinilyticum TaxID=2906793 RepID=A0ABT1N7L0_9GAMM|nr:hypothetical protein [Photobacterium sp. ZSDE20]MCQ1060739.1 hypothetical protein [Photobacterium sp. ZSDE20]MDD1828309.1 hypothetical protein [Photobacterium sp. ZSDE20]